MSSHAHLTFQCGSLPPEVACCPPWGGPTGGN